MRVAFIGVSHWHTPFYLEPAARHPDCELVGVADPDAAKAERLGHQYGVAASADYRTLCETTRPDVVFAFGRHLDMPAEAEYLIEAGIPFAMEKPCGTRLSDIERLESTARAAGAFVAIPFAYRLSRFVEVIAEGSPGKELTYGMFRQIPGPVSRYSEWDVEWNLDPKIAGGGCTLNLSIHFYDLARLLAPSAEWSVSAASMSKALSGAAVEDFSATLLEHDGRRVSVETGYFHPTGEGETVLSVTMEGDYYRWDGNHGEVVRVGADGERSVVAGGGNQVDYYAAFVSDTLRRVDRGDKPDAGLSEMVAAARLAEQAYRRAGDASSMT